MQKIFYYMILVLLAGILLPGTGKTTAESDTPRIILYTYYRQMGWGDRVQIGSIDENGVLRTLSGHDSDLKWPYKPEEQLEYLSQTDKFAIAGTLKYTELFAAKSLIFHAEDQGSRSIPAACDAGTEKSYAVRYEKDGSRAIVLLGMSGDDFFENLDPDTQALYLLLRHMFPGVTSYAYGPDAMGPQGFEPIPFAEFTGLDADTAMNSEIRSGYIDCEAGYIPLELTEEEKTGLLSLILEGKVTGKADCLMSGGDIYSYAFYDPDGSFIESLDFSEGLLIRSGCRYYFGMP